MSPTKCRQCGNLSFRVDGFCTKCATAAQAPAGDDGMKAVAAKAEGELPGWKGEAGGFLEQFVKLNPDREFLAEEVGPWAYEKGCRQPHDDRAWGLVMKEAGARGIIEQTGRAAKNRLSGHNSRWSALWRAVKAGVTP